MEDRYLFKAKRIDNGEWVIGYLYRLSENNPPFIMLRKYGESYEVDEHTICQCTGLKDKNGKLIYENDIVSHKYKKYTEEATDYTLFGCIEKRKNYVIIWDNTMVYCGFRYHNSRNIFQFKNGTVSNGDDEVIGNIFDNPELLESEG